MCHIVLTHIADGNVYRGIVEGRCGGVVFLEKLICDTDRVMEIKNVLYMHMWILLVWLCVLS